MEPIDRYAWKQLAVLTALALAVRLVAAVYWQVHWSSRFFFGDSQSYWNLAQAIAHGQAYRLPGGEQIFRTPGYPLLLAPVAALGDGPTAIFLARVENCLIGALAVPLAYVWATRLFNARAAFWAACIAAVYPEAIATNVAVLSDTPLAILVCLTMIAMTIAWQKVALWTAAARRRFSSQVASVGMPAALKSEGKPSHSKVAGRFAAAGALAGLTTLVHPSWLLFMPFAVAIGVVFWPVRLEHLRCGVITLSALAVVMLPWWIRNACVSGRFVPTTLQVGASLYDGLNPSATGGSDMRYVPEFRRRAGIAAGTVIDIDQEQQLDQAMRRAALAWAWDHPGESARLAGIKFLRMWNIWPNEPSFSAWPIRLAVVCSYGPVIVLALWGAWQTRRQGWVYWLCWLPAVYFSLLHVVFVSSLRYRQPAMLGLIVLAADALENLRSNFKPSIEREPPSSTA